MLVLPHLLSLLLLALTQATTAQPTDPFSNVKLCRALYMTHLDYPKHLNASRLREQLANQVGGCQYLQGDLDIYNWGLGLTKHDRLGGDIREMKTDFLDSLLEISGRLVIWRVNVARLELRNLRVIRNQGSDGFWPAIVLGDCPHPIQLVMPRLAAVVKGGGGMYGHLDQGLFCRMNRSVGWNRLFSWYPEQRMKYKHVTCFRDSQRADCNCSDTINTTCDTTCGRDSPACWAGDSGACQYRGTCRRNISEYCYLGSNGMEQRCHSACLGGCNGTTARDCYACKGVNFRGECLETCPTSYNDATVFQVGTLCLDHCPAPFFLDSSHRSCVTECPAGQLPWWGVCTECNTTSVGSCQACDITYDSVISDKRYWYSLSDELAEQLASCPIWKMEGGWFVANGTYATDAAWRSLASARVVKARVLGIMSSEQQAENLAVLSRLTYVSGELFIRDLNATYLALSSLRSTEKLSIINVRGLCRAWFPLELLQPNSSFIQFTQLFGFPVYYQNVEIVDCPGAECHPSCQSGCWGPGPDLCVVPFDEIPDPSCR